MDDVNAVERPGTPGFRGLMSGFPSGVVVVTTVAADGEPQGLTCSSLCSVSLRPPLLLVCIANRSRTLSALTWRGFFAVNLLHQHGRDTAHAFSTGVQDRFGSVNWAPAGRTGLPQLLDDAHLFAECAVHTTEVAGDHTIVVGEVLSVERLTAAAPLMYGLRQYAAWPGGDHAETVKGF